MRGRTNRAPGPVPRRRLGAFLAVSLVAILTSSAARAQAPAVQYVYDPLNRLVGVVDQDGNAAVYTYDAVGNILRIDRIDAADVPGPIGITAVIPPKGKVGTRVTILGKGFGTTGSQNSVSFGVTGALIATGTVNRIETSVPPGALTAPISVTSPRGTASSREAFVVLGAITVSPTHARVILRASRQFQASEAGTPTTNVAWTVNKIPGGDATVGTISAEGLYTAPATVPSPAVVTVMASHRDDPTLNASAPVEVIPPQPVFVTAAGLTVGFASPPITVDRSLTASVSISPTAVLGAAAFAPPVSVQASGTGSGVFVAAAPTSMAFEPLVTGLSPASGAVGASNLLVTISGAGLEGATTIQFLVNNAADPAIAVTSLLTDPDGTRIVAEISIASGAAVGSRVVQITTETSVSTPAGTGGNVFTVQ